MEFDEPCLEWAPYMPATTVQEYLALNQNVPLGTGTYCTPKQDVADLVELGLGLVHTWRKRKNMRGRGTSTPHGISGGHHVIPQECGHA